MGICGSKTQVVEDADKKMVAVIVQQTETKVCKTEPVTVNEDPIVVDDRIKALWIPTKLPA